MRLRRLVFGATLVALLAIPPGARALDPAARRALARLPKANLRIDAIYDDAAVADILQHLAEVGKVSIVVSDAVRGRASVRLRQVRWHDALGAVLDSRSLTVRVEGTVVFVEPLAEAARADRVEVARRALEAASAPLVTRVLPLGYARASELAPIVRARLGPRATVRVDARTNALVVTAPVEALDRLGFSASRATGGF